jgi:predicted DNA-binding transcriptional regulator AlpA
MSKIDKVTVKDLAQILGLTLPTVRKLYTTGKMPAPIRLSDRVIFWKKDVIEQWLKEKGI